MRKATTIGTVERESYTLNTKSGACLAKLTQNHDLIKIININKKGNITMPCGYYDTG